MRVEFKDSPADNNCAVALEGKLILSVPHHLEASHILQASAYQLNRFAGIMERNDRWLVVPIT